LYGALHERCRLDHLAMPLHQDREGHFGGHPVAAGEHLDELAIGMLSDHPTIEERVDVLEQGPLTILHPLPLPDGFSRHLLIVGLGMTIAPTFSEEKTNLLASRVLLRRLESE